MNPTVAPLSRLAQQVFVLLGVFGLIEAIV